nr:hypothetical protein [Tanacetum cinerariifolium]
VNGALDEKRKQTLADLSTEEKIRYSCDIKATNMILLELPVDIYILINHFQTAKEIWDRVKELMEGIKMTLSKHEMSMKKIQVNKKFVNDLQPEWSWFVTVDKQPIDLHKVNFDQLYAFLKHNENDAKEV